MTEAREETSADMWSREDQEREIQFQKAKLFIAWTAGWLLRQVAEGAAMAVGGYVALHSFGVI
jgi:hypothetical protein